MQQKAPRSQLHPAVIPPCLPTPRASVKRAYGLRVYRLFPHPQLLLCLPPHSCPRLPMKQGGARSCQHPGALPPSDSWSQPASCGLSRSPGSLCIRSSGSPRGDFPPSFLLCLPSLLPSPKAQLLLPFRKSPTLLPAPGTLPPPLSPPNLKPGAWLSPFPLRK